MVSHNQQNSYIQMPNKPMGWWSSVGCDWPYPRLGLVRLHAQPVHGFVEFCWLWLTIPKVIFTKKSVWKCTLFLSGWNVRGHKNIGVFISRWGVTYGDVTYKNVSYQYPLEYSRADWTSDCSTCMIGPYTVCSRPFSPLTICPLTFSH
jgi:hypothetical protein